MTSISRTSKAHTAARNTLLSYSIGFILSILLTLSAFWIASLHGSFVVQVIIVLAILQLLVQLRFFLHLRKRDAPTSHRYLFAFTLCIVAIVIGGTLWIMHNLERLHMQMGVPMMNEMYQDGIMAPQNELK
jgi:cytochrome o ubiquinol oxidase operon protein cyoD